MKRLITIMIILALALSVIPYSVLADDVIKGDVDGSGKVDATDYILIKRHILGISLLTGDMFARADLDGNSKLDATDYIQVKRIILGIGNTDNQESKYVFPGIDMHQEEFKIVQRRFGYGDKTVDFTGEVLYT